MGGFCTGCRKGCAHVGEVFLKANLICKASPSLTNYKIWYVQTAQNRGCGNIGMHRHSRVLIQSTESLESGLPAR